MGTYPPGDRIVPANARHTVRRMQVAAVAAASVVVHRIAVVQEWDSGAVAVTATLSAAADSAAHSAAVRSSVSAFAAEVDMAVSVAGALVFAVVVLVPAGPERNLP